MVVVYGWNPWAELASIEPANGGAYGDQLVQMTRWYFDRLVQGQPYRLFEETMPR